MKDENIVLGEPQPLPEQKLQESKPPIETKSLSSDLNTIDEPVLTTIVIRLW